MAIRRFFNSLVIYVLIAGKLHCDTTNAETYAIFTERSQRVNERLAYTREHIIRRD